MYFIKYIIQFSLSYLQRKEHMKNTYIKLYMIGINLGYFF